MRSTTQTLYVGINPKFGDFCQKLPKIRVKPFLRITKFILTYKVCSMKVFSQEKSWQNDRRKMSQPWRDIEEFPEYLISEYGQVMNNWTQRIMTARPNRQGFMMVGLVKNGRQYTRAVAGLVAEAYLPPRRNPAYNSLIHLNGDRSDCRASNLMWRPRWFAIKYHQMFDELPTRVSVWIPSTGETFSSLRELCTTYGLIENHAYTDMNNGIGMFHYGFRIERYRENV